MSGNGDPRADFARRLRALMKQSGLSLRKLAEASAETAPRRGGAGVRLPLGTVAGMTSETRPVVPERVNFEAFVDTCLRVAAATGVRLPDELGDRRRWDQAYRALRNQVELQPRRRAEPTPAGATPLEDELCPYPGLDSYGPQDAAFFFGRESIGRLLLDRVAALPEQLRPLLVTGPSGSGKSSLLNAALIPALDRDGVPHLMARPGRRPLPELLAALPAPKEGAGRRVVIVDQFEDVFTVCPEESDRAAYIEALAALAADGTSVVLGVRADFFGHCYAYPALAEAVAAHLPVGPLNDEELRQAIERPATATGLALQPGLADLIVDDLRDDHDKTQAVGALPLLSHALRETWHRREDGRLTFAGYHAAGGITGSLAQTADTALDRLDLPGRRTARRLFVRLVRVGHDTPDTARPLPLAELRHPDGTADGLREVADHFVAARLLTADAEALHITHEALIRGWPQLVTWIEADRAALLTLQRLDQDARQWDEHDRDPAYLYTGARLETARQAADAATARPSTPATVTFLSAGLTVAAAADRAAVRRRRLARAVMAALTVLTLVASGTGIAALLSSRRAVEQRDLAVARSLITQAESVRSADPATALRLDLTAHAISPGTETRLSLAARTLATRMVSVLPTKAEMIAASANGRFLVTYAPGLPVSVWDLADRTRPRKVADVPLSSGDEPAVAAISPDGARLFLAETDLDSEDEPTDAPEAARPLWDLTGAAAPRRVGSLPPVTQRIRSAEFAGGRLVAAYFGGSVRSYDAAGSSPITLVGDQRLDWDDDDNPAVVPSPFDFSITGQGETLSLWGRDGRRLSTLPSSGGLLALSAGSRQIAVEGGDGIDLWDVRDPRKPRRAGRIVDKETTDTFADIAFSDDARALWAVTHEGSLTAWSATDQKGRQISGELQVPANTRFLITAALVSEDAALTIWAPRPDDVATLLPAGDTALHPSGRYAAVTVDPGQIVKYLDLTDPERPVTLASLPPSVTAPEFTPDGRALALESRDSGGPRTAMWDTSDPARPRPLLPGGQRVVLGDFAPDGRVATGFAPDAPDALALWRLEPLVAGRPLEARHLAGLSVPGKSLYVKRSAFSPDGRLLILLVSRGAPPEDRLEFEMTVFDIITPERPVRVATVPDVSGVAWTADGKRIITTSVNLPPRIWDLSRPSSPRRTGELGSLPGDGDWALFGTGALHDTAFTAATEGSVPKVTLWDLTDPAHPSRLTVFPGQSAVPWPDGRRLLTPNGGELWRLDRLIAVRADPVAAACAILGRGLGREEWQRYAPQQSYRDPCAR